MPEPAPASPRVDAGAAAAAAGSAAARAEPAAASPTGHPPGHTACPRCHHSVDERGAEEWFRCASCGWSGRVLWFSPVERVAEVGAAATPDDAVCAHHPGRRAEAVCAGSGAYVCPLCAVELNGRTFDVAYVEAGGATELGRALQRELPRPDRHAIQCALLPFIPVCVFVGPLFWIGALAYGVKHFRLRRADPLYREVSRHGWVVAGVAVSGIGVALSVLFLGFAALEGWFA